MARYPKLSAELTRQLEAIEPSVLGGVKYYPCAVWSADNSRDDCVYIMEETGYFRRWGIWPEDDHAKRHIDVSLIRSVAASPNRLPVEFADRIYDAGESGMGFYAFSLRFRNGLRQTFLTGDAVEFLPFPSNLRPADVVDVTTHAGAPVEYLTGLEYSWGLHSA
jgi:hypothetical protein